MRIDLAWLRSQGVSCEGELGGFAREFPDGVELSRDSLRRAAETGRQMVWFAERILPPDKLATFLQRAGAARLAMEAAAASSYAEHHAAAAMTAIPGVGLHVVVDASAAHAHRRALDSIKRAHTATLAALLSDVLGLP